MTYKVSNAPLMGELGYWELSYLSKWVSVLFEHCEAPRSTKIGLFTEEKVEAVPALSHASLLEQKKSTSSLSTHPSTEENEAQS